MLLLVTICCVYGYADQNIHALELKNGRLECLSTRKGENYNGTVSVLYYYISILIVLYPPFFSII